MVVVVNVIIKIGSVKFPLTLISRFIMHFGSQKKKKAWYMGIQALRKLTIHVLTKYT